jgi:predicted O-methyltransferase YrrM
VRPFDIWNIEYLAARFNPVYTGDEYLDTRYNWQKHANGAEWPYYRFFYHLSRMLQPGMVVELGGYQGTAAAHFAAGYPDGNVTTIDHHTDPGDDANKELMKSATRKYPNLLYIQGWTNPEAYQREKGKHYYDGDACNAIELIDKEIDILFIDSWHNYENAMLDWTYYKPLLNSPALVICDDIQEGGGPESPISGMMQFWQELPEPKFLNANLHPGTNMGFLEV